MEGRELPARLQAKDTWGHVDTRTRGPGCVPSRRRRRRAGRKHLRVCGAFAPSTSAGLKRGLLKRGSGPGGCQEKRDSRFLGQRALRLCPGLCKPVVFRDHGTKGGHRCGHSAVVLQPGTRETGRWVRGAVGAAEGADGTPRRAVARDPRRALLLAECQPVPPVRGFWGRPVTQRVGRSLRREPSCLNKVGKALEKKPFPLFL